MPAAFMRSTSSRCSAIWTFMCSIVALRTRLSLRPWPSMPGTRAASLSKPSRMAWRRFCSEAMWLFFFSCSVRRGFSFDGDDIVAVLETQSGVNGICADGSASRVDENQSVRLVRVIRSYESGHSLRKLLWFLLPNFIVAEKWGTSEGALVEFITTRGRPNGPTQRTALGCVLDVSIS